MKTWAQILERLEVMKWEATPPSQTTRMPALVNAQVISLGGVPRGVVDVVTAALVAHHSDASRLLTALNDRLIVGLEALKAASDQAEKARVLADLLGELAGPVLRDTGAWVKRFDEVVKACDVHDATALHHATKSQRRQ